MRSPSSASIGIGHAGHKPRTAALLRGVFSFLLALSICVATVPAPAVAASRPTDSVDGVSVSQLGAVRKATPDVSMRAGVLVDSDGRVLWSRQPDSRRAMASITKIMTAVVALESSSLTETVDVTSAALRVGESTSFLRQGDRLTMQDMLEALLVKSGNDAAEAIAIHVSGSTDAFVDKMNRKAVALGLSDTHFKNAHGLDAPGHKTTARDLAVLSRYAMSKPAFKSIVGKKQVTIGTGRRKETLPNTNVLINNYEGVTGIKTGYTSDAGYCVVGSAERNDIGLYAVVLGTQNESSRFRDARELLDWGFAHYRPQSLATSGTILAEAPVSDYLDVTVPAVVSADTTVAVLDLNGPITRTVTVAAAKAPVSAGQTIGTATFTQAGRQIASIPLVAKYDVRKPNPLHRIWIGVVRVWRAVSN